jgi:N6-adenosine-specific RNA methylase IME4
MDSQLVVASESTPASRSGWNATGLIPPEGLTIGEWSDLGAAIAHQANGFMWWIGDWWLYGERYYGEQASQAAGVGVAPDTLSNAAAVASRIEMPRRRGNLSWSHHRAVAYLGPIEQDEWLERAVAENLSVMELRRAIRRARVLAAPAVVLPVGKYSVFLADPPWQYDFVEADNRAIENQYPTLPAHEIACFEDSAGRSVADLAADDAVLYLWATNPKLREALEVMEGWGFTYVTNMVWVKDRIGMGYWARARHELLLIGKRGDFSPPEDSDRPDSVIEAPRTGHSVKPEEVYELLERLWPDAPKVELFARSQREGWAAMGNQL